MMYKLQYFEETNIFHDQDQNVKKSSSFMVLLKNEWDRIHLHTNAFRYRINNLQEKVIGGKYLIQLNPDRGINRRLPQQIDNIYQEFDSTKFNFTKVSPQEILFQIVTDNDSSVHAFIVNVSPISRYHTLMCPSVNECLPQVVTQKSITLVLSIMYLAGDRALRIGFNSLCGLASVNHLHYHLFVEPHTLPVENVTCKHIKGPLYCLDDDYPVPGFCFQVASKQCIEETSSDIYKIIEYFLNNSIAHNILITVGAPVVPGQQETEVVRVVLWPRKSTSGVKQLTAFNVAVCEFSGWFPVFNVNDYENLTEDDLEKELKRWKINQFNELSDSVKSLY